MTELNYLITGGSSNPLPFEVIILDIKKIGREAAQITALAEIYIDIRPGIGYESELATFFGNLSSVPRNIVFRSVTFRQLIILKPPYYNHILGPLAMKHLSGAVTAVLQEDPKNSILGALDACVPPHIVAEDFSAMYRKKILGCLEE